MVRINTELTVECTQGSVRIKSSPVTVGAFNLSLQTKGRDSTMPLSREECATLIRALQTMLKSEPQERRDELTSKLAKNWPGPHP